MKYSIAAYPGFHIWGDANSKGETIIWANFAKNCIKMKKIGTEGARIQNYNILYTSATVLFAVNTKQIHLCCKIITANEVCT